MKKKLSILIPCTILCLILQACGTSENTKNDTVSPTESSQTTETHHEHVYIEKITTTATCETDGEKTFYCECGDTYTETITATGHIFENYTYNEDSTYENDGTETATCKNCELTDTRTAENTMLSYSYTEMNTTMYAQKTVNVRSLPNSDGEKLGSLSTNDEIKVTGQCNETKWYRIEFQNGVGYVSNSYLDTEKVVVQQETPAPEPPNVPNPNPESDSTVTDTPSDSVLYAEKHGYSIGDVVTLEIEGNYVKVTYLGNDKWESSDGERFTTRETDNGDLLWYSTIININ